MASKKSKQHQIGQVQLLHRLLLMGQHLRLMLILACLGAMSGIVAYCYTVPVYYSRTIINWQVFGLPFHEDAEDRSQGISSMNLWRNLKQGLEAETLIKQTAIRLGVAKQSDEMEDIRGIIRIARILFRDSRTLLIEVYSTDAEVVRDYPAALLETYENNEAIARRTYRQKATEKYLAEVGELKNRIDEGLKSKLDFEKNSQFASLTLKQERLMKLPADIDRCKAQLDRMAQIKADFSKSESTLDSVTKLSLLSAFDKEWSESEKLRSGDVVRRAPNTSTASPFNPPQPPISKVDVVVVGPSLEQSTEMWRTLEKEKRTLEEDIRQQSSKYLPGHEIMRKNQSRLEQINRNLAGETELALERFNLEFERLKEKLPSLESQLPEYYATAEEYEKFRKDYALMEKGQQDWAAAHNDLSKRLAAMQFGDQKHQTQLILGPAELLEDKTPLSPTVKKSAVVSFAMMLALALGVPLAIGYVDTTVTRLPQLEARLELVGLGMIPTSSRRLLDEIFRSPALGSKVPNFLLECFRVIRSNIILHPGRSGRTQVIALTSARPGEGKSTLAANMAWAFFSMGERTLLIDVDLRRGRTHEILNLPNTVGLSNHFAGEVSFESAIQKTVNPNLDVVTRGPFMPGASEFLAREEFSNLVSFARSRYDRIVLDGPPVLGLSETLSLQRVADGVVLVVRAESTPMNDIETCVEQLRRGDALILGFVLNRLDLSKPSNHYYYYYSSPYYYGPFSEEKNQLSAPAQG